MARKLTTMLPLDVTAPFSFPLALEFMSRFMAFRDAFILEDDRVTAAATLADGTTHAFSITHDKKRLVIKLPASTPASAQRALRAHAAHMLGAADDLAPFYAAAAGDPPLAKLIDKLHGLHHVCFPSFADAVVYSILMQRTPMSIAATYKRRFLAAFGIPVTHAGRTLYAMPLLPALAKLDAKEITAAIKHGGKAERLATVIGGVNAIGESFLRTAPYARARDALLEIDGIGPFAATAILLRGLGRMDELPWMPQFAKAARAVYGRDVTEAAIVRRYGDQIGYWSFYVMTAAARTTLH